MSKMSYHRKDSCGKDDFIGFIDQIEDSLKDGIDHFDIEMSILERLITCINERFESQKYFSKKSKVNQDHINTIKVYYDLYVKLKRYFPILLILLSEGVVSIVQGDHQGFFNHSLWLFFKKEKTIIPFSDVGRDPKYLKNLQFQDDFDTMSNLSILDKYIPDWSLYPEWYNNKYVKTYELLMQEQLLMKE